jgi:SAM-dependent methyltransferase
MFWDFIRETAKGKTFGRVLMNQALMREVPPLKGRVVDIGGGNGSSYERYIDLSGADFVSTNIDPARRPTHAHDANSPLPFADASVDAVLVICVIHILRDQAAFLKDIGRVLKPGGSVYVVSPFLFAFNPEPEDYVRLTPMGFRKSTEAAGLVLDKAVPISGRVSTAEDLVDRIFFFWPIKLVFRALALLLDRTAFRSLNERFPAPGAWLFIAHKERPDR